MGNLEKLYIGRSDEPLCGLGVEQVNALKLRIPEPSRVYCSPMLRRIQANEYLFGRNAAIVYDLRECDFCDFEENNFENLQNDGAYRAWAETNCETPGLGDDVAAFKARSVTAFIGCHWAVRRISRLFNKDCMA